MTFVYSDLSGLATLEGETDISYSVKRVLDGIERVILKDDPTFRVLKEIDELENVLTPDGEIPLELLSTEDLTLKLEEISKVKVEKGSGRVSKNSKLKKIEKEKSDDLFNKKLLELVMSKRKEGEKSDESPNL